MLAEADGGTELRYTGEIECNVHWLPGMGWLIAMLYVRGKYNAVIRAHMEKLSNAAESRAARSHVFRRSEQSGAELKPVG